MNTRGSASAEALHCRGAFVFIGAEPGSDFLPPEVARDERGYILTGMDAMKSNGWPLSTRDPCALETTLPRVLAAGDIRSGSTKRVGIAVGDGSLAVSCAHRLISQLS
jgi:thioredoxin reductase (NADPH)